jgi:hypothetical protein
MINVSLLTNGHLMSCCYYFLNDRKIIGWEQDQGQSTGPLFFNFGAAPAPARYELKF